MTNENTNELTDELKVEEIINDISSTLRLLLVSNQRMDFTEVKMSISPEYFEATTQELLQAFEEDNYSHKIFGKYVITDVEVVGNKEDIFSEKYDVTFSFKEEY